MCNAAPEYLICHSPVYKPTDVRCVAYDLELSDSVLGFNSVKLPLVLYFILLNLLHVQKLIIKKEEEERKITSAAGAENRTMSQLIFNSKRISTK